MCGHTERDAQGHCECHTIDTLINVLQDVGMSSLYDDVQYLSHVVFGTPKHTLTKVQIDQVMELYHITKNAYAVLERNRKSSLGRSFRLFKILEMIHYDVKRSDFKMPKKGTPSNKLHHKLWKQICDMCTHPLIVYIEG